MYKVIRSDDCRTSNREPTLNKEHLKEHPRQRWHLQLPVLQSSACYQRLQIKAVGDAGGLTRQSTAPQAHPPLAAKPTVVISVFEGWRHLSVASVLAPHLVMETMRSKQARLLCQCCNLAHANFRWRLQTYVSELMRLAKSAWTFPI